MTNYILLLQVLLCAVVSDVKTKKIPNGLCIYGIFVSLVYCLLVDKGALLHKLVPGMCIPFCMLFFLYAIRVLGAGDVKLMCVVGTYIGMDIIGVIGLTFAITALYGVMIYVRRIRCAVRQGGSDTRRVLEHFFEFNTGICFSIPIFFAVLIYLLKEACVGGI